MKDTSIATADTALTEFVTAAGKVLKIQSIPPLLIDEVRLRAQQAIEVPPIPTYEVELADGSKLNYEHDAQSILDSLTSDEDRKLWTSRQEKLREQTAYSSNKVLELFLAKGVILDSEELEGDWREIQEFFGVEIPTGKIALHLHYLKTEILRSTEDIYGVMEAVMKSSGIDPVILEAAKRSFRRNLRFQASSLGGASDEVSAEVEGQVENEPAVPRVGDGQELGIAP